ncbi:MAG: DNA topoisomerase IA, partial [Oleiphilaceae bacterium]
APNQDELDMWRGKSEGGSAFHKYLGYYLSHAKYSDSERKGQPRCINLQPQEKTLVLIEAGGKKDTLSEIMTEIMGPDFHIEVSGGAITQLALDDKSLSFKDLKPHYQLTDSGESFINRIVETYGDYDRICLATDDDNVGECIAWHIYHQVLMRLPDNEAKETFCKRVERVKLRAISKDKVEEAFKSASKKEPYDKARVASEILREITDNIMARKLGELLNDPQISLESKNQSLMQSLLGANVIKENGSNTSFQGLGRVKLGILALLVENAQHKLNSQMIFGKPQQIIPKVTMPDGQLIPLTFMDNNQDKDKDNQKYKSTTQAIFENMKDNRVPGTLSKWEPVLIEPAAHNQISTLDVLAKAAQECGMRPSVVMNALQRLYEGKV